MFEVKKLSQKYFYGATAIVDVSFCIGDDEQLALFAKEGGGKTSLLKCIAGLYLSMDGSIFVDGKDISSLKIKERNVRMVYASGEGLFNYRSCQYNLAYPLSIRKQDKRTVCEKVYEVAARFGLTPFLSEPTYRLYPEEKIRLALARCAMRDERITLIDNIFCDLTGYKRQKLFEELLPEMKAIKGNVIFATDDPQEAIAFGEKLGVLNAGELVDYGTHHDVILNPANYFIELVFNKDRCKKSFKLVDGTLTVDGEKFKVDNNDCENVFATYTLKEVSEGREFVAVSQEYISPGVFRVLSCDGEILISSECKNKYFVAIDTKSIHIYDNKYEKRLTISKL